MMQLAERDKAWKSSGKISVLGTGCALPGSPISTEALITLMAERFDFTRLREASAVGRRLGIRSRHVCRPFRNRREEARPGQSNAELAASAVLAALKDAGIGVGDIGYLIGHTATPTQPLPSNISIAADYLKYAGPHIELRQACTGFANALMIAFGLLSMPGALPVAIVGSETGSLFFDPGRLATESGQVVNLVQMGDGAAAIILGPEASGVSAVSAAWFGAIGLGRASGIQMHAGAQEFDHDFDGIRKSGQLLFEAGVRAAADQGVAIDAIDTIIPHQVSGRIGGYIAEYLGVPDSVAFVNADRLGNMGSAAIWMALADLRAAGISRGSRILTLGAEATKYMHGGFLYEHT